MEFETYLKTTLDRMNDSKVKEACAYSLFAGGKRVRPALGIAMMRGYGLNPECIYPFVSAIELIHTYSLIHDDLPAMDNDTLRRGKPTCHIAFDEATAILAGDALLTEAFHQVCMCECDSDTKVELIKVLSDYSGGNGMVLGQIYDLEAESKEVTNVEELEMIHKHKTGKLLTLPLIGAALLANRKDDIATLIQAGEAIGLSFQIQDDILDVVGNSEELGKNINSDVANHKSTYVTLLGLEKAGTLADQYYEEALSLIRSLHIDDQELTVLFKTLAKRKS